MRTLHASDRGNLPLRVEKLLLWQIASAGIQKADA